MKITNKVLSIPPHLSTSWSNIASIQMKNDELEIILSLGQKVRIQGLSEEIIKKIFETHANYLEKKDFLQTAEPFAKIAQESSEEADLPLRLGFNTLDQFGTALQHNPAHAHAPNLPPEILQKIGSIAKLLTPEAETDIPQPEPHCNCMHCQIARAIQESMYGAVQEKNFSEPEVGYAEEVSDADLHFCQWEIKQMGEKLFLVTSRLDSVEAYRVYLGQPVGCTCGLSGCEHILAVLKS